MPSESVIAASAAIIGGIAPKIVDFLLESRSQNQTDKREFHHEVVSLTDRAIRSYEQYVQDYEKGDEIPYTNATRCKGRLPDNEIRQFNINRPGLATDELINDLRNLQNVAWDIDQFNLPPRTEMDPLTVEKSEEYLELMNRFYNISRKVHSESLSQLE
ncbi:hypothetical protein [Natrinema ejinorense]|uniref:hypothetical protein n=1 Tax=Natrinema ejinorense TaxID=373386 RepID=UPI0011806639|nr:hypothetical protein [Natrinema ejinorense]